MDLGVRRALCGQSDPRKCDADLFILHADHEQNASTRRCARRLGGRHPIRLHSSGHCLPVGAGHGGANEAALNMLHEIGRVERIPEYIARAKDKNDPFRLMGFGHRVYKNYDPRAKVMQRTAEEVLKSSASPNPSSTLRASSNGLR